MSQVHFCHQYFLISMYLNLKVCHSTNKSYLNSNGNSHAAWAHENSPATKEVLHISIDCIFHNILFEDFDTWTMVNEDCPKITAPPYFL